MRRLLTCLAAGVVLALGAANASAQAPEGPCGDGCQSGQCERQRHEARRAAAAKLKPDGHVINGACQATCRCYKATMDCLFFGPYPSHAPWLRPPGDLAFPTNPYVRSPRDFFMAD